MRPKKKLAPDNPEQVIREALKRFLELRGWYVKIIHGGMYLSGMPDLYCTHRRYGIRWVEVKLPGMEGSRFTTAQHEEFPKLSENGTPIWILTAATEYEYRKLFEKENWFEYYLQKM